MQAPEEVRYITIAQVDRARGLSGEVVVTVHADDPARMAGIASVFLRLPEGGYRELRIEGFKRLQGRAVIKLRGVDTPEAARTLAGAELFIRPEAATPAGEGRYHAYQLEGLPVRLADGSPVGVIREVLRPGPQSLLVIDGPRGEILVPFAREIVTSVDVEAGQVTIDPPDGLMDLNAPAAAGARGPSRRSR